MPEPMNLDDRLAAGRATLLTSIDQPPLARIGRRAATLRRRRRATMAAGALTAVVAAGTFAAQPWRDAVTVPPPVADGLPTGGPVYTGAGITINGLVDPRTVIELRGTIADVEFADPDHGYLVTACAGGAGCQPIVARTEDGGLTWTRRPLPDDVAPDAVPDLVTFAGERLALWTAGATFVSPDGGRTWTHAPTVDAAQPQRAERGEVLRLGHGAGGCSGPGGSGPDGTGPRVSGPGVEVWGPQHGSRGALATQPGLTVCWVAPVPAPDGTWWVSGTADGRPAVAYTADGGRTWSSPWILPGDGAARVARSGQQHVYAVVTGAGTNDLRGIYHSVGGGEFAPVPDHGGRPSTVAGEPAALLDGRLVLVSDQGRWYVSTDDGASFTLIEGNLPVVGRLARTAAGYVAYDLFHQGWAAFSSDGATWRKFPVRAR